MKTVSDSATLTTPEYRQFIEPDGEAKFWIEPAVDLATNHKLSQTQVMELKKTVEQKKNDILDAWGRHFAG